MGVIMKKIIILSSIFLVALSTPVFSGEKLQKLAQTGMKFLSVSTDARFSALGDASTSIEGHSSAMFFNPASMAAMTNFTSISLGQVNWIADINYVFGSAAFMPKNGLYGVFGISVLSVDYGIFKGTIRDSDPTNELGYLDTGDFSPNAIAFGVGYAKALSDKFSVGGNIKYVRQDLTTSIIGVTGAAAEGNYSKKSYNGNVFAYDLGILYKTGFKNLNFGMCIRNFSEEVKYEDEGFQLPLTFKVGISMNIFDLIESMNSDLHSLLLIVDAVHPRDYYEQLNIGAEYLLFNTLAFRLGYSSPNDEHGLSMGVGFQKSYHNYQLALDYAYTNFGVFNDVHRVSLHFGL